MKIYFLNFIQTKMKLDGNKSYIQQNLLNSNIFSFGRVLN